MTKMEMPANGGNSEWKIWHQDNFDLECPRRIEVAGEGLLNGLKELWKLHLFETVQESGQEGFSHFDMWWARDKMSIRIVGIWDGQVKLRSWVYTRGMESKTTAKGTIAGENRRSSLDTYSKGENKCSSTRSCPSDGQR